MRLTVPASALCLALASAACGSSDDQRGSDPSSAVPPEAAIAVTAAFYPLEWASRRVGGDLVDVTGLTKPGGEPHDLELTPKAVAELASSDVVVYLKAFQPAVDDAIATQARSSAFDVSTEADLSITTTADAHDHEGEGEEHSEEEPAKGAPDPHFWLDPLRLAKVGTALGERFASADPAHAQTYRENATALASDLQALHADFEKGLSTCANKELVTGHTAFAYLAARYGLSQEGIAGVSPDAEPDAASIREIVEHVKEHDVGTVYSETLVSPALSETIARESGAQVAVLDPLEGLTDSSAGDDYLEVMRSNLQTLTKGQECG